MERINQIIILFLITVILFSCTSKDKKEWEKIKNSNSIANFENFQKQYPDSKLQKFAKNKFDSLVLTKMLNICKSDTFNIYRHLRFDSLRPHLEKISKSKIDSVFYKTFKNDSNRNVMILYNTLNITDQKHSNDFLINVNQVNTDETMGFVFFDHEHKYLYSINKDPYDAVPDAWTFRVHNPKNKKVIAKIYNYILLGGPDDRKFSYRIKQMEDYEVDTAVWDDDKCKSLSADNIAQSYQYSISVAHNFYYKFLKKFHLLKYDFIEIKPTQKPTEFQLEPIKFIENIIAQTNASSSLSDTNYYGNWNSSMHIKFDEENNEMIQLCLSQYSVDQSGSLHNDKEYYFYRNRLIAVKWMASVDFIEGVNGDIKDTYYYYNSDIIQHTQQINKRKPTVTTETNNETYKEISEKFIKEIKILSEISTESEFYDLSNDLDSIITNYNYSKIK